MRPAFTLYPVPSHRAKILLLAEVLDGNAYLPHYDIWSYKVPKLRQKLCRLGLQASVERRYMVQRQGL